MASVKLELDDEANNDHLNVQPCEQTAAKQAVEDRHKIVCDVSSELRDCVTRMSIAGVSCVGGSERVWRTFTE